MLCDRLVCGINDSNFQKRLLSEGDKLTLADALAIAQALESAVQDSEVLATSPQVQPATVAFLKKHTDVTGQIDHCRTQIPS